MAENELLERLARALQPGGVEPPPARVLALRHAVEARAAAGHDAASEPGPPSRVNGANGAADDESQRPVTATVAGSAPFRPALQPPPAGEGQPGATTPSPAQVHYLRRIPAAVPRVLSGAFAAAAVAILVAMVAAQDLPSPLRQVAHGVGLPVDSTQLVAARHDADELALALARRDAAQVAEADAAMLKSTNKLEGDDLQEVRPRAVKLHVEALAFLRDNPTPEALSDLPTPAGGNGEAVETPDAALPGGKPQPEGSTGPASPPTQPGVSPPADPTVPPVVPQEPRTVTIRDISPRLDATFQVDFEVSGFTLGPDQPYAVEFSFDDGRDATTYSGLSPWRFPLLNAVRYHRLCAQVVDADGVAQPDSGNCFDILLL